MTKPTPQLFRHFVIKLWHRSRNQYGRKIEYAKPRCYLWDDTEEWHDIHPAIFGCYGELCCPETYDFATAWNELKTRQLAEMWKHLNRVISNTEVVDASYEVKMLKTMIKQLESMECPKYPTRIQTSKVKA
jgi:hypothetical protein